MCQDLYDEILNEEAGWISRLQMESGAVPMYSAPISAHHNQYKVTPYFSHFGLLGLLEKPESAPVVRKYMDWYFDHMNRTATPTTPAGSVFDYLIEADRQTEVATRDFDSTDSYASTFLNVLRKYAEVTSDITYLREHRDDIFLIADAMIATKQNDGLTWAKPDYRLKYLMDNSEVFSGLQDMEWLCLKVFRDDQASAFYRKHKEDVYAGIENGLWSGPHNAYAYAKSEDGSLLYPDWTRFYADATAQLFPIWTGVLPAGSERAKQLYDTFNQHHPRWPVLEKPDSFPWALIAYTAAIMGDRTRTGQFLTAVKIVYIDRDHPWPWYVMESGITMLMTSLLKKLSNTL
jgi:hypothetical protein